MSQTIEALNPVAIEAVAHGKTQYQLGICQAALKQILEGTSQHRKRKTREQIHQIAMIALRMSDRVFQTSERDVR